MDFGGNVVPRPLVRPVDADVSNPWASLVPPLVPPMSNMSANDRNRTTPQWKRLVDQRGRRLTVIEWNNQELHAFTRSFLIEHPDVKTMTDEQCRVVRNKHGIKVTALKEGVRIPKPVESLETASFPRWASEELRSRHWEKPSPIQMQAWPIAMRGFDLVGIAATGSGKTMAYVLPMLLHVVAQEELKPGDGPIALVLQPTRELTIQVRDVISTFSEMTGLRCEAVFGGEDIAGQSEMMLDRVDILTATPGRLESLLDQQLTNLRRVTLVVVDEADELLARAFKDQIEGIMSQIRPDRQVLLFTATYQDSVKEFAETLCKNHEAWKYDVSPGAIEVNTAGGTLAACKDVSQTFLWVGQHEMLQMEGDEGVRSPHKDKALFNALQCIAGSLDMSKVLVFCNRPETVNPLASAIQANTGLHCEGISSGRAQTEREDIITRFRGFDASLPVLVTTSLLSRGVDFYNVGYVINYDMPSHIIDYIHRIGRTGRQGKKGFALTLLRDVDLRYARDLVMCLQEAGQTVPPWLEAEVRNFYTWRKLYFKLKDSSPTAWGGRGKGKRLQFLRELGGTGAARGLSLPDED